MKYGRIEYGIKPPVTESGPTGWKGLAATIKKGGSTLLKSRNMAYYVASIIQKTHGTKKDGTLIASWKGGFRVWRLK